MESLICIDIDQSPFDIDECICPIDEFFLRIETPGEIFCSLADSLAHDTTQHAKQCIERLVQFDKIYKTGVATKSHHEPIIKGQAQGYRLAGIQPSLIPPASLQSSQSCLPGSALCAPPQSCPSLGTDDSEDGRDTSLALLMGRAASITATATVGHESIHSPRLPGPPIFTSIRQVLSSDPSYAEDVILAVCQLPHEKRTLLFEFGTEPADDSGPPTSPAESSKKRPRSSNGGGDQPAGRPAGEGQGDGGNDNEGGNVGAGGKGDCPPPRKKPNKDKNRRWICPYSLAYHDILQMGPTFSHCWPGNMTEVHLWRDHLKKHHSPSALNADPHAKKNERFYMDSNQLEAVLTKIKDQKGRPRSLDVWLSQWTGLFLEVWRIIFPKDRFPDFKEPWSPFHQEGDERANLARKANALLEPIINTRKKRAALASGEDFRPSEAEMQDILSEAFAIALSNSPGAAGATQWLHHASTQTLQTAAADCALAPGSQSITVPHGMASEIHAQTLKTTPGLDTAPMTCEPSYIDADSAQTTLPISRAVPLTLFPNGTKVTIYLLPANTSYLPIEGQLQLAVPGAFHLINFNQAPLPPPSAPLAMTTPNTLMGVTQSDMGVGPGLDWQQSPQADGAQGISMQAVQRKPLSPEEALLDDDFLLNLAQP